MGGVRCRQWGVAGDELRATTSLRIHGHSLASPSTSRYVRALLDMLRMLSAALA